MPSVSGYVKARRAAMDRLDELRDEVCRDLPGGAQAYKLHVRTSCVPLERPPAPAPARSKKQEEAMFSAAANRKEIAVLEQEMQRTYPDPLAYYDRPVVNGAVVQISHRILQDMMSPKQRRMEPDPIARYNKITEAVRRAFARKGDFVAVEELQRFMILRALLSHLRSI